MRRARSSRLMTRLLAWLPVLMRERTDQVSAKRHQDTHDHCESDSPPGGAIHGHATSGAPAGARTVRDGPAPPLAPRAVRPSAAPPPEPAAPAHQAQMLAARDRRGLAAAAEPAVRPQAGLAPDAAAGCCLTTGREADRRATPGQRPTGPRRTAAVNLTRSTAGAARAVVPTADAALPGAATVAAAEPVSVQTVLVQAAPEMAGAKAAARQRPTRTRREPQDQPRPNQPRRARENRTLVRHLARRDRAATHPAPGRERPLLRRSKTSRQTRAPPQPVPRPTAQHQATLTRAAPIHPTRSQPTQSQPTQSQPTQNHPHRTPGQHAMAD
jgi:hypothetical protein